MLEMEVNDDAGSLTPRGALRFFASMLAPTGGRRDGPSCVRPSWLTGRPRSKTKARRP